MELLLNLCWLALALPAIWMWRHESVSAKNCRCFARLRPFLLFGCGLMLLFPVVSATDDLHAMRQEIEEFSPSKRMVKQAAGDRSLAGLNSPSSLLAVIFPVLCAPSDQFCGQILVASVVLPPAAHFNECASRAPPFSSLGEGIGFAA